MLYFGNTVVTVDKRFEAQNRDDKKYFRAYATISNDNVDSDGHYMGDSTLKNFGGASGVQVKDSHLRQNGFGVTFDNEYNESLGNVTAGLRISRGMPLGEGSGGLFGGAVSYKTSDAFITAIEDEIIKEVSIGAYGGDLICKICNMSMLKTYDCEHWPLEEYEVNIDGVKKTVVCYAKYIDGKLREVSLVDKGACPGAEFQNRLDGHITKGVIPESQLYAIKARYGVMDNKSFSFPDADPADKRTTGPEGDDIDLNKEEKEKVQLKEALEIIEQKDAELKKAATQLMEKQVEVDDLEKKRTELYQASLELETKKTDLREDIFKLWKENRGLDFTGDELKKFEDRITKMDFWNLEEELRNLQSINKSLFPEKYEQEKEEEAEEVEKLDAAQLELLKRFGVEPGSKTKNDPTDKKRKEREKEEEGDDGTSPPPASGAESLFY